MTKSQKFPTKVEKITYEKSATIYPLSIKDAVAVLLKVKPKPKEEKAEENKAEKPSLIAGLFLIIL